MAFFDSTGSVVCYFGDEKHIYLWTGRPVAYLRDGKIYAYSGAFLGWFENGWFYDQRNRPSLFSREARGGPVKPVKRVKPVKGVKSVKPVKGVRRVTPMKPVRSLNWSSFSGNEYFDQ